MDNKVLSFFSSKKFPEETAYYYLLILFVISNFLALIASIIKVAAYFSTGASHFLGFSQGLGLASAGGLLIILARIRAIVRNLFSSISKRYPEYASVFLKFDEVMVNVGISITAAGLILNLFLPFGFLAVLLGITFCFHFLVKALKDHEQNEMKVVLKITGSDKLSSFFSNVVVDKNTFVLMFITLCGYLLLHPEYFQSIKDYYEHRGTILTKEEKA
ncbi:hypothetical protein [Pseudothermotoga thermarum]|uniref:Uncharacterized protein n=1 Tax=Pseudothermotoga thermarum DSM 5069 TaxID=688269 RepID=F7YWU2_9THEM|nr:hypothetical protein [Pseudothermotoga thermarum]AEH50387.1 hypothetical protein Theth_0288 [Pseudothermotoga thermarum DSM 5069]